MLPAGSTVGALVIQVAERLHSDRYIEGGQLVADWLRTSPGTPAATIDTKEQSTEVLTLLLHWLLENDGYEEAAELLWGKNLFDSKPESTQRVWKAFEEHNFILLMGAASMSKSYSMGVRLFLEWVRDPEYTSVRVLGPSENHLEDNLFTHLVTLHRASSIPLPGEVGKLFIGADTRARKGAISGLVIPLGKKAAGRIQGSKRVNRKVPHPVFGIQTRQFIFLDEIANIPIGVWKDIDNIVASSQGDSNLKVIGAFNPANIHDEVGLRVEPPNGWANFDLETDVDWVSTRGWRVVRLDAARCENVVSGRTIFPGLQTKEGFEMLIRNAGGTDSPGYYSMGRGCFPPSGVPMSVIPPGMLVNIRAEPIWLDRPTPCGAVDLAFLGGDTAVFAKGSFGMATGFKYPPSFEHPEGRVEMFKNAKGRPAAKNVLWLEALLKLPRGETVAIKNEIIRLCRSYLIRPEWLCVDKTGAGQGVFDLLRFEFGEVIGLNFSEGASETKIMTEDHAIASELYERAQSELWFALRKFIEFNYFKFSVGIPTEELHPQLTNRRYRAGKRAKVEPKQDYQSRCQGKSPDEADAVTLLVHCVRKAAGFIPGMSLENSSDTNYDNDGPEGQDGRTDVTNRHDHL